MVLHASYPPKVPLESRSIVSGVSPSPLLKGGGFAVGEDGGQNHLENNPQSASLTAPFKRSLARSRTGTYTL